MATVPLDLHCRFKPGDPVDDTHNRLMFDRNGGAPYIPPLILADILALRVYYYDEAGGALHRYPASVTTVRLRAQSNNITYATANSTTETAPPPIVTQQQVASASQYERHKIVFNATGGAYRLTFTLPTGNPLASGHFPSGTTGPIALGADPIESIQATIEVYRVEAGVITGGPYINQSLGAGVYVRSNTSQQIELEYLVVPGGGFSTANPPLVMIDSTQLAGVSGWNVSLVLDGNGNPFSDLFAPANGPPYLEVLLNGDLVAQQLLLGANPTAPEANFIFSDNEILVNGIIFFTDVTSNTPTSWLWHFGDGVTSTLQNPAHQYTFAGTYSVRLIVSNASGSSEITKTGFVVTAETGGGSGGGGGGGGGSGTVGGISDVYYDVGNLTDPYPIEDVRVSNGIPNDAFSFVYRQRYAQFRVNWQPLGRGENNCPHDSQAVCIDEVGVEDIGGLIRVWERVWARVPGNRTEKGAYNKILKRMMVQVNNGVADLNSAVVSTRVASVQADVEYRYYNTRNQTVPAMPDTPDVAIIRVGNFIWVEAYGGFNPNTGGLNYGGNNFGRVFLAGDTRPYMGSIVEQLRIFG